jgi:hypothetical protein
MDWVQQPWKNQAIGLRRRDAIVVTCPRRRGCQIHALVGMMTYTPSFDRLGPELRYGVIRWSSASSMRRPGGLRRGAGRRLRDWLDVSCLPEHHRQGSQRTDHQVLHCERHADQPVLPRNLMKDVTRFQE